jgi:nucleoside-diphosphate-sugar epimerase
MIHKVLVTGCSGFIGKEVSEFFLSKNYKVYGLDKVKSKNIDRIRFFKCDIEKYLIFKFIIFKKRH